MKVYSTEYNPILDSVPGNVYIFVHTQTGEELVANKVSRRVALPSRGRAIRGHRILRGKASIGNEEHG